MIPETLFWLDGESASTLPLPDRGLDFGDGLFETLLLRQGVPLHIELHLQRLRRGLQTLAFPDCLEAARQQLTQAAAVVCERGWRWSAVRLTVSRGTGPRGYAPPDVQQPRIIISAVELQRDCQQMSPPANLSLASLRWSIQPALAGIKHLNRLEQVMAAAESRAAGTDDAVMLDQAGRVVSAATGNLFLLRDAQLFTPALQECGIEGTRRRLVLDSWAPSIGLAAIETTLSLQDLYTADEVFYCNALLGLRAVARLGEHRWHDHTVCAALHRQYLGDMA